MKQVALSVLALMVLAGQLPAMASSVSEGSESTRTAPLLVAQELGEDFPEDDDNGNGPEPDGDNGLDEEDGAQPETNEEEGAQPNTNLEEGAEVRQEQPGDLDRGIEENEEIEGLEQN